MSARFYGTNAVGEWVVYSDLDKEPRAAFRTYREAQAFMYSMGAPDHYYAVNHTEYPTGKA